MYSTSVQGGQNTSVYAPDHLQKCIRDQNRAIGILMKRFEKSLGRLLYSKDVLGVGRGTISREKAQKV